MRSASIAEWIVSRFTSKKRATSVVGDLVELEPQKGTWWSWFSLAQVVLSLSWRKFVAFIAALYAGSWMLAAFQAAIVGIRAHHRPPEHPWILVFSVLSTTGAFLWMTLMYLAIRYGLQDRVTRFALASTGLVTAVIFYWWQPVILFICVALSIWMMSASILKSEHSKVALVLLVTVMIGLGSGLLSMYLVGRYQHFLYPGPMGDQEMREHPSVSWIGFCMYLIVTWVTTTTCSRMHHWLERDKPLDEEAEEGLA